MNVLVFATLVKFDVTSIFKFVPIWTHNSIIYLLTGTLFLLYFLSFELPMYRVFPVPSFPLGKVIILFLGNEFIYLNIQRDCYTFSSSVASILLLLYSYLCCQFTYDSQFSCGCLFLCNFSLNLV